MKLYLISMIRYVSPFFHPSLLTFKLYIHMSNCFDNFFNLTFEYCCSSDFVPLGTMKLFNYFISIRLFT